MRPKSVRGLFATMLLVAACSPAPPSPTLPPSAAPSPTASFADTIRISMAASLMPVWINTPPTGVGPLSNANFQATRPYSDPGTLLRPLIQLVKPLPNVHTISSCMMLQLPNKKFGDNGFMLFADCAVVPDPTVDQLASIAVEKVIPAMMKGRYLDR